MVAIEAEVAEAVAAVKETSVGLAEEPTTAEYTESTRVPVRSMRW